MIRHNIKLEDHIREQTSQLDRLNNPMSAILEGIHDAILVADQNGCIRMADRGFEKVFGYVPDERFAMLLTRIATPESYPPN